MDSACEPLRPSKEERYRIVEAAGYALGSFGYLERVAREHGFDLRSADDASIRAFFVARKAEGRVRQLHCAKMRSEAHKPLRGRINRTVTLQTIATSLGMTRQGLHKEAKKQGFDLDGSTNAEIISYFEANKEARRSRVGRKPSRGASLDEIAASLGVTRQGLHKAAKKSGWPIDIEIAFRQEQASAAPREDAARGESTTHGEGSNNMGSKHVHETTVVSSKSTFVTLLEPLREDPTPVKIGHAARCLSMLASRTRMGSLMFVSFAKDAQVINSEAAMLAVIESVPLLHYLPKSRLGMLVSLAVPYTKVMTTNLADTFLSSMTSIDHPSAEESTDAVIQYLKARSPAQPSPAALEGVRMVFKVQKSAC